MISNSTPVQCPYIPEHKMHIDSFITHLNRCKATNKHLFANCLYNSLHVVLKQNYKDHLENCEDRTKFTNYLAKEEEDDEWDQECYERSNSQNRTDSHFSSSYDDYQYYGYHQQIQEYSQNKFQQPFYGRMPQDEKLTPKSYFSVQHKHQQSLCQTSEKNNSLDFSFGKDHKARHPQNQKRRFHHQASQIETCESSFSFRNDKLKNEENSFYVQKNNEDDDVIKLIKDLDFKTQKLMHYEDEEDILGNRLAKICNFERVEKGHIFDDGEKKVDYGIY